MNARRLLMPILATAAAIGASAVLAACGSDAPSATGTGGTAADRPVIVATTPMLGALVRDAVGDAAEVEVVMPNGSDPHEWRPSARDVARLQSADLVVENGLNLEEGLQEAIARAREDGVAVFTAADHVDVREVEDGDDHAKEDEEHGHAGDGDDHAKEDEEHGHAGDGDDHAKEDEEHGHGGGDPHFWTDPSQAAAVVAALPAAVQSATGADISGPAGESAAALRGLNADIASRMSAIPEADRVLVTGHESLGYLADRYGLDVVGTVTPSLSSQGQVSAAHLADLERAMEKAGVRVLFTESGVSDALAQAIRDETGATVVELGIATVPSDGSYTTYIEDLSGRISSALTDAGG
ncbi:MAG: metal ABC transporter substrate-binding protein [Thermoleophilia bacterium]